MKICNAAMDGNEKAQKMMKEIDQSGIPSSKKPGGIHCRYASKYTRFAKTLDVEVPDFFLKEIYGHHGRSAAGWKKCTKAQLQQKNLELEAKVEKLQRELDECTSFMLQLKSDVHKVSAHHIV